MNKKIKIKDIEMVKGEFGIKIEEIKSQNSTYGSFYTITLRNKAQTKTISLSDFAITSIDYINKRG